MTNFEYQIEIGKRLDYLKQTDYIMLKLAEAQINNDTDLINELKTTYKTELETRILYRSEINKYQAKLK